MLWTSLTTKRYAYVHFDNKDNNLLNFYIL